MILQNEPRRLGAMVGKIFLAIESFHNHGATQVFIIILMIHKHYRIARLFFGKYKASDSGVHASLLSYLLPEPTVAKGLVIGGERTESTNN